MKALLQYKTSWL